MIQPTRFARALVRVLALALLAASCASAPPARPAPTTATVTPPPPVAITEAPRDWQLLDEAADRVPGVGLTRALRELVGDRPPARTVVVAVIDGGIDTAHVDLRANLWKNPKETPGNNRDDDGNGYVDDVWGWNFIGGPDGANIDDETLELTRIHAACTGAPAGAATTLTPTLRARCPAVAQAYEKKRQEAEQTLRQVNQIAGMYDQILPLLRQALGSDSVTTERVRALRPLRTDVARARDFYLQLEAQGITPQVVEEAREEFEGQLATGLNVSFDVRTRIVRDDPKDLQQRAYGNRDVTGPDAKHGTHVAGIIGAVRGNNEGIDGIAPAVRLMAVRAVPDGDERDKDVANAIRYAVDQGAHIINMSFGKGYSPEKRVVDEAVKYADAKGVLMIHAAGNDAYDLAQEPNFPSPVYEDGGRARNWIEVGASSWKLADSLAAPFSNYGREHVDVFAPGVDILSTVPGGGYERQGGTSMAAPVVTGIAALIMAYHPSLTATDVKRIIIESAVKRPNQMVVRPGSSGERIPFSLLSATGGIVNAYAALKLAAEMAGR